MTRCRIKGRSNVLKEKQRSQVAQLREDLREGSKRYAQVGDWGI